MNKLELINRSECYVLVCKVLQGLESIDFVKLCFIVLVISQNKVCKHINDFFRILGNNFKTKQKDISLISDCVCFLEKAGVVAILDSKVTLKKTINIVDSDSFYVDALDVLYQVNEMSINSFVRMVAQYV